MPALPSAITVTLPAANALGSGVGQRKTVKHISTTGTVTVAPAGSDSIRLGNTTVSTLTLNPGDCYLLTSTGGTFWEVVAGLTASVAGGTPLVAANNLSDVVSASTSRTNLGLGTAAVLNNGAVTPSLLRPMLLGGF